MFLRELTIRNLRAIEDLRLDSLDVQQKRKQYRKLKKKPRRTAGESRRLKELKTSLADLPDLTGGLSRHQQRQTEVLEGIRQALAAAGPGARR